MIFLGGRGQVEDRDSQTEYGSRTTFAVQNLFFKFKLKIKGCLSENKLDYLGWVAYLGGLACVKFWGVTIKGEE